MKKINSLILIFLLIFTFTITSYAMDYNLAGTDIIDISEYVDGDELNVSGTVEITDNLGQKKDISIVCAEGTKLTLNGVDIETKGRVCPITFTGDNNELIIKGSSTISSYYFSDNGFPGIQCNEGSTLTITGNETAILNVESCNEKPAIGGLINSGHIIINSGNINATGGRDASVIGGGKNGDAYVTINGGNLNLETGWNANGIGAGIGGSSDVTINGGNIEINRNLNSYGIADNNDTDTDINITGGKLTVKEGSSDIGIGNRGQGLTNINISGGTIDVDGQNGGIVCNNGNINISGDSKVTIDSVWNVALGSFINGSAKINILGNSNVYLKNRLITENSIINISGNSTVIVEKAVKCLNSEINIYGESEVRADQGIIGRSINIFDNANVTALGEFTYPTIGGENSHIAIYDNAEVNATGATNGVCIGGYGTDVLIDIYGNSRITANNLNDNGVCIGGIIRNDINCTISIHGNSDVIAKCNNSSGAAIGGGFGSGSQNTINIYENSNVVAENLYSNNAAIGYGTFNELTVINIKDTCTVEATGGMAIGGETVNISGSSKVYAKSYDLYEPIRNFVNITENSVVFLDKDRITDDTQIINHIKVVPASELDIMTYGLPDSWMGQAAVAIVPKGKVVYLPNGATGGNVPIDLNEYDNGDDIIVLGNSEGLTRQGYDFLGWYLEEQLLIANDVISMGEFSISLNAGWTPRDDTPYTVNHYKYNYDNGIYELADTDNMYGTTESTVQAISKDYDGYIENENYYNRAPEGIVKVDGSLVLKLYYTAYDFDVTFDKNTDDEVNELPEKQKLFEGEKAAEPADPSRLGYEFDGWFKENGCLNQFSFTEEEIVSNITLFAKWNPNDDTKYTVKHLKEKITLDGYVETDIDDLTGTSGTLVNGIAKEYIGFSLKESVSGIISGDGELILNMYYDRNEIDIIYNKNTEDNVTGMPRTESVHYELTATEPDRPLREGYSFDGWYKEISCTNEWNFDTDTVTRDTIIYAKWIESEKEVVNYIDEVNFTISYEGGISEVHKTGDVFMLSDGMSLSKEGYILSGWADESNTYLLGAIYEMPTNNVVMNPIWLDDRDNDGISDEEELAAGTDPLNDEDKPYKGSISIKVVDSNGKPIEGITCILNSAPLVQYINSEGFAVFNDVDMSKHTLTLLEENHVLGSYEFNLTKGENNLTSILSDDNLKASINDNNITLAILIEKAKDGSLKITEVDIDEEITNEISVEDETNNKETIPISAYIILIGIIAIIIIYLGYRKYKS